MNVVARAVAAALTAAVVVIPVGSAHADTCPVMTFEFDPNQGALVLNPPSVTVAAGACVTFNNQTATFTEFEVGSGYRNDVPPFSETVGDGNYQATAAGTTQPVTATGPGGSASGSIVIQATSAPASSQPAPPPTTVPPPPPPASSPAAHPTPHRSGPAATRSKPPVARPPASPPPQSPLTSVPAGAPPVVSGPTSPSPSRSSGAVVVAGPLQPPTGRGTGLPAAVAALVIVGTSAALLRVLLSYPISPVDGAHSVGAAS